MLLFCCLIECFHVFFKVLEEKEEKIAPGTLLGTTHTYATLFLFGHFLLYFYFFICMFLILLLLYNRYVLGTQDKSAAKRVGISYYYYYIFSSSFITLVVWA